MAKIRPYAQNCPVARTLDIVGDRWTLLIIRDLFLGKSRFNELRESSPGLPPKLLSQRLKRLEEQGLVERRVYNQYPLRAEYFLTAKGRSLFPVVRAMGDWGLEYMFEHEPELRDQLERHIKSTLPEFQDELMVQKEA